MKDKIRKELKEIRKNLSKQEVLEKSNKIKIRLFEIDEFKQASTILFYVSYDNEVYTHDMIKECISDEKNVIVPISDKENRRLILSKLINWVNLEIGSYGILEPRKDKIEEFSIDNVDLVIVPGIGFDESGHRIGHGKGYYDELLKNSTKASHIGLAFETQIVKKIPTEAHDLPVYKIITEKRVIDCRRTR
jgi:5-formyltetrahydrofolate cyclo-ligase